MTDHHASPPIVDPQSLAAPQNPDCTTHIVSEGMDARSGASENALSDDDEQWLHTVLKSLDARSSEARKALQQALEHGAACGNPAGLTTTQEAPQNVGKLSSEQWKPSVVSTIGLHNLPHGGAENPLISSGGPRVDQGV